MSTGGGDTADDAVEGTPEQLRLLAAEAEAEALEIEARADAARARARALRLRLQADQAEAADKSPERGAEKGPEKGAENGAEKAEAQAGKAKAPAEEPEEPGHEAAERGAADAAAESVLPAPTSRWQRLRGPRFAAVTAGLAMLGVVAALGAGAYMVRQHHAADLRRQHAAEFAAAAQRGVIALTSLDYNEPDEGIRRILDESTGTFRDDFQKTAKDFMDVVRQSKVVEHGAVKATAVDLDSMTDDSAVVLVASTSEVSNAAGAKKDPREFRLIVTVTREGDQIKMSKVEFVP